MRNLMELQSDREKMDMQIADGSNFKGRLEEEINDFNKKSIRAKEMLSAKKQAIMNEPQNKNLNLDSPDLVQSLELSIQGEKQKMK